MVLPSGVLSPGGNETPCQEKLYIRNVFSDLGEIRSQDVSKIDRLQGGRSVCRLRVLDSWPKNYWAASPKTTIHSQMPNNLSQLQTRL